MTVRFAIGSSYSFAMHLDGSSTETVGQRQADGTWDETVTQHPPRELRPGEATADEPSCRVYWGSHGCCLVRGHAGPHMCECAWGDDNELLPHASVDDNGNVGCHPYYGDDTEFFGEDADADPS